MNSKPVFSTPNNNSKKSLGSIKWWWSIVAAPILVTLCWTGLIGLILIKLIVFQQVTVVGESMRENYFSGDGLLVNQVYKKFERGQVVAVYRDKEIAKNADFFTRFRATIYLKRIIALPGEQVEIFKDKVIIYNQENPNGFILKEDYIDPKIKDQLIQSNYFFPKTHVDEKQFFLLGDNRINSADSRILGTFPDYSIFGEESLRFWPIARAEVFQLPKYETQPLDSKTKNIIEKMESNYIEQHADFSTEI